MLQGKAIGGVMLLVLLGGCTPTGKEARILADAAVAPSQPASQAAPTAPAPSVMTPGVRVFIDPRTGLQRTPTAQEWADMVKQPPKNAEQPGTSPPSSPVREMVMPDGTMGYDFGDAAMSSSRACKQPDGAIVLSHDCPRAAAGDAK